MLTAESQKFIKKFFLTVLWLFSNSSALVKNYRSSRRANAESRRGQGRKSGRTRPSLPEPVQSSPVRMDRKPRPLQKKKAWSFGLRLGSLSTRRGAYTAGTRPPYNRGSGCTGLALKPVHTGRPDWHSNKKKEAEGSQTCGWFFLGAVACLWLA